MENIELLEQIAVALALGFGGGLVAKLVGLSPMVGYLGAGVLISPFTPGWDADVEAIDQLASLGVIFLMFGAGMHFSLRDLASARGVAVPGALIQMVAVTAAGYGAGSLLGLEAKEGLILGLALALSSTVVLVHVLDDRGMLGSRAGGLAVAWLIVQDLAAVIFLAMLPSLDEGAPMDFAKEASIDVGKSLLFLAIVLPTATWLLPNLLAFVARRGTRELFILAVVTVALAIATGAAVFGISVALGAFVAGLAISESETSHQAAADVLPLREAFAVLFFVAIGMLIEPQALVDELPLLIAAVAVILVVKGLLSAAIVAASPYSAQTALFVGAGLAQAGEFSFILGREALHLELVSEGTYNVILGAAAASIIVSPLVFAGIPFWEAASRASTRLWGWADRQGPVPERPAPMHDHVIIAGFGRVGRLTGTSLAELGIPFVVIEADLELSRVLSRRGLPTVWGDSSIPGVLEAAGAIGALLIVVAVPDERSAMLTVAHARRLNPSLLIVTRARETSEVTVFESLGARQVVVPEIEGGLEVARQALVALGMGVDQAHHQSLHLRDQEYGRLEHEHEAAHDALHALPSPKAPASSS